MDNLLGELREMQQRYKVAVRDALRIGRAR